MPLPFLAAAAANPGTVAVVGTIATKLVSSVAKSIENEENLKQQNADNNTKIIMGAIAAAPVVLGAVSKLVEASKKNK
jgi:hypothetical protein